jgi:hypothetical protein
MRFAHDFYMASISLRLSMRGVAFGEDFLCRAQRQRAKRAIIKMPRSAPIKAVGR